MRILRQVPIKRKLIIIHTVTNGVALLLACLAFTAYELVAFRESAINDLATTAAIVGANSSAALTFNDSASAEQTLRTLEEHAHIVGAALYTRDGKVFAGYRRSGATTAFEPPPLGDDGHRFGLDSLELVHRFELAGEPVGAVYILSDLSELKSRMQEYAVIAVLVLITACVVAFILSARLQASISGPISHLAQVVARVSVDKTYAVRATKSGEDELGDLIDGFNAMLQQIQSQDTELQEARDHLERRVTERTRELRDEVVEREQAQAELQTTHKQLVEASRQAGRAEVAISVLHNVGNVLNSVNVSASVLARHIHQSKVTSLPRVASLLDEHSKELGAYLSSDPRGRHLPTYIKQLSDHLQEERETNGRELDSLRANIDHIKQIVSMQQAHSRVSGAREALNVADLVEDSLRMSNDSPARALDVVRDFTPVPPITTERHKILQILVNLVRNARRACQDSGRHDQQLTVRVARQDDSIQVSVIDNGVGIAAENLNRIFSHGFTTRKDGHGFGLHSSALSARELGGSLRAHSDGEGCGATFVLELPLLQEAALHA